VKLADRAFSLLCGIILARELSLADYGMYTYYFSMLAIISLPVISGLPSLLVREVTGYLSRGDSNLIRGIKIFGNCYVMVVSFLVSLVILFFMDYEALGEKNIIIVSSIVIVVFRGGAKVNSGILHAHKKFIQKNLAYELTTPLIVCSLLFLKYIQQESISISDVFLYQAIATCISYCLSLFFTYKLGLSSEYVKPKYDNKNWFNSLIPLSFITIISTLNIELCVYFLGSNNLIEDVAIFKVALQGTLIFSVFLQVVNSYFSPDIVKLYQSNKLEECQSTITKTVRVSFPFSVLAFLFLLVFGESLIVLLFGENFREAYTSLIFLSGAQLFNVFMGSSGVVMSLAGYEKQTVKILGVSLVVNVLMLILLTPLWGLEAVILANVTTIILWNILIARKLFNLTKFKCWLR